MTDALAPWIPAIVSSVLAIYIYGRLAERVKSIQDEQERHSEQLDDHADRLGAHDVAITKLQAWHEGYEAALATANAAQKKIGPGLGSV